MPSSTDAPFRGASPAENARLDVKICGVCDPADAAHAVEAGATHVGVIRVPGAGRARMVEVAAEVCAAAAGARRVGVYVDAEVATILAEADRLGLEVVQLHGSEAPADVAALKRRGLEVWKVVKPRQAGDLLTAAERYAGADLILAEGFSDAGPGGVGARLDWTAVEGERDRLAPVVRLGVGGGLTPENVAAAVRRLRPSLVDVSSGVERAHGSKDPARVRAFIDAARAAAGTGSPPRG